MVVPPLLLLPATLATAGAEPDDAPRPAVLLWLLLMLPPLLPPPPGMMVVLLEPPPPMLPLPVSFGISLRRIRIPPGSHSRRIASDEEDDDMPVRVLFAAEEAILDLRSGKVSITRSRNSNRAPTSFCNSCNDFV